MGLHGAHTPLGHAEWGALNPLAEWIAGFAPETSVERNEASFSGGVAIPFVNDYFYPLGGLFVVFAFIANFIALGGTVWGPFEDSTSVLSALAIAFAILLMNMTAPLIDRYTLPRVYGHRGRP